MVVKELPIFMPHVLPPCIYCFIPVEQAFMQTG